MKKSKKSKSKITLVIVSIIVIIVIIVGLLLLLHDNNCTWCDTNNNVECYYDEDGKTKCRINDN